MNSIVSNDSCALLSVRFRMYCRWSYNPFLLLLLLLLFLLSWWLLSACLTPTLHLPHKYLGKQSASNVTREFGCLKGLVP
ncbi:hypothetical protein F5Y12DRAFT_766727 [Xylaria sp. FL1777]|nr:hypothetical protein F5Y12DRAFT_766727 [Xylaria sp. FL1777]